MRPAKDSFRLTKPDPSKNTPLGPILLGLIIAAGGGVWLYVIYDETIRGAADDATIAIIKSVCVILLGMAVAGHSTWRLLKGETSILLQNNHLHAPGQTRHLEYREILDVQKATLSSWDVVVLRIATPVNDAESVKSRQRIINMGLKLTENDVALWVSQSGWIATDLVAEIQAKLLEARQQQAT
jgi:hypothetical protein